ncbi:MAG: hypothetical protein M0Q41_03250 [Bacteroidales bacterium]|nr:hypothetical protein [Bacteroidales bacterium]
MQAILLPHSVKKFGWILLIPATLAGIFLIINGFDSFVLKAKVFAFFNKEILSANPSFGWIRTNITQTLVGVLFLIGALLVGFSKEKQEDEFIASLRLSSLLWAVLVNYTLLLLAFLFVYGLAFLDVMLYNMFTILVIFIFRFHFVLYRSSRPLKDEKHS